MVVDELLEMSRKMAERLKELQARQSGVLERLTQGVSGVQHTLDAVGEVIRSH